MDRDMIDDIELIDDVDVIDDFDIEDEPLTQNKQDVIFADDLVINEDIELIEEKKEEPVKVPVIELPEEVVVEDIMSKTYNLAEVVREAKEDVTVEPEEFDGKKSAMFIGILFVVLVIFILALPYITKLMVK